MTSPTTTSPPPVPAIVRRLGPVIRALLRIGLPMGPNVLLTVRGRKSGVERTFPVAILEADGREVVFSPFGEVQWVANLRASGEAVVRHGRRSRQVAAIELAPETAGPLLADGMKLVMGVPVFGSMISGWYGVKRQSAAADYLAAARRHPAFELMEIGRTPRVRDVAARSSPR